MGHQLGLALNHALLTTAVTWRPGEVVDSSLGCIVASNGRNGHDTIHGGHVNDGTPSRKL